MRPAGPRVSVKKDTAAVGPGSAAARPVGPARSRTAASPRPRATGTATRPTGSARRAAAGTRKATGATQTRPRTPNALGTDPAGGWPPGHPARAPALDVGSPRPLPASGVKRQDARIYIHLG